VYDFGFYLHQENTTGGYPEPFAQKIQEVQALSPYYLLFGKQTDRTGVYTRFWVDLVLPDTGRFECLDIIDPAFKEILYQKAKITTALVYESVNSASEKYHVAELATIDTIQNILDRVLSCCYYQPRGGSGCTLCLFDADDIKRYFEDKGFLALEITLTPGVLRGDSVGNVIESKLSNNIILHDYADKVIGIFNGQTNIGQSIYQDFLNYPSENLSIKILVTNNESFCLNFSEIDGDLANNTYDIFSCNHIWRENMNSTSGLLFYMIEDNTTGSNFYPSGYIYHDNSELDSLLDFDIIESVVQDIYDANSVVFAVNISNSDPLDPDDCWIKVVNEFASQYNSPGLSNFLSPTSIKTDKSITYANYRTIIGEKGESLNKAQKSYMVAYIIAHEFLHQLLIKSFHNILRGCGTILDARPDIFRENNGIHFDCWLNLNTSGPLVSIPTQLGENSPAELIIPTHVALINESRSLMSAKAILGINSTTFRLKAHKSSKLLNSDDKNALIRYLTDNCEEVTIWNQHKKCECGW